MSRRGYSLINMERILGLPFGSLNSIIKRELFPLPEEVALVRIIFHMPWIMDAYDNILLVRETRYRDENIYSSQRL